MPRDFFHRPTDPQQRYSRITASGPQTLDRTANDALTSSDLVTRAATLLRTVSDAVTSSDTVVGGAADPAFQADSFQNDAFQTAAASNERTASDAVSTSDVASRTGQFLRAASDSVSTSDAVVAVAGARTAADSVTTSDAVSIQIVVARTASDVVSTSDAAAGQLQVQRTAADAVSTSDAVVASRTFARTADDVVSTSDAATRLTAFARTASDTITVAASVGRAFSGSRTAADHLYVGSTTQTLPLPIVGQSAIVIDVEGGSDYFADVVIETARFTSQVNGQPGDGYIRVRDDDGTKSFTVGQRVLLTINGDPVWRGFISSVKRVYVAPALNVTAFGLTRFIDLELVDTNILFQKRIVVDAATPENVYGTLYPAGTDDKVAITDLVTNFLDLTGDNIDTNTYVEAVGTLDPAQASRPWSGGFTWAEAMASIAMIPAGIYYLSPTLVGSNLVYTDDDTATALFGLSDQPDYVTTFGYREMEVLHDGGSLANDVLCWGFGYGSNVPVFARAEDAASQATHGLWQYAQANPGVSVQATVDRIADSILNGSPENLRGRKDDKIAAIVTTYQPGLLPAQKVAFASEVFGYSDTLPVRKMEITFVNPTTPRYVLTLSHDIDAPWGFVDQFMYDLPNTAFPQSRLPGIAFPSTNCAVFDDFERIEVSGWGTASSGYAWTSSGLDSQRLMSVTSGEGRMYWIAATGGSPQGAIPATAGPWVEPSWEMTCRVRIPVVPAAGNYDVFFRVTGFARLDLFIGSPNTVDIGFYADVPVSTSFTWSSGQAYFIRWSYTYNGAERIKIWLTTDPEPATWLAEADTAGVGGPPATAEFDIRTSLALGSNTTDDIFFDNIVFCLGGASTTLVTDPSGRGCETATRLSSTQYQTSRQYVPGTTEVYVDGYRQRPGIAREYTEDTGHTTITFNSPVSSSATVTVCYYISTSISGGVPSGGGLHGQLPG
jgi:hypothetical protein